MPFRSHQPPYRRIEVIDGKVQPKVRSTSRAARSIHVSINHASFHLVIHCIRQLVSHQLHEGRVQLTVYERIASDPEQQETEQILLT